MFNKPYGKKSAFGGKSGGFSKGGSRGGKSFGGGRDWKPMHDATCASCGTACQVPFKPNGRKPVLCSNCFSKDNNFAPKRFDGPRPERSSARGGSAFGGETPSFGGSSPDVSGQLKEINAKLDAIIEALES